MKKNNKKGFTLAELLIVVAIIAILVAIAIPVFSAQLEKSKIATDKANIRAWYGEVVAKYLSDPDVAANDNPSCDVDCKAAGGSVSTTGAFSTEDFTVTYTNTKGDGMILPADGATAPAGT